MDQTENKPTQIDPIQELYNNLPDSDSYMTIYTPVGFELKINVQSNSKKILETLEKAKKMEGWLLDNGFRPFRDITPASKNKTPENPPPPSTKKDYSNIDDPTFCKIHQVPMKQYKDENTGETWYSHQVGMPDGTFQYCKGKWCQYHNAVMILASNKTKTHFWDTHKIIMPDGTEKWCNGMHKDGSKY